MRLTFSIAIVSMAAVFSASAADRPNILWLTIEDTSDYEFGCYGSKHAKTPNVDKLSAAGIRYERAWSTAPQCSPARSSLITGCYATTYGMDWHRDRKQTPADIFYPPLLREAGYFCTNNHKTDYNTRHSHAKLWDAVGRKATYNDPRRKPDQPFFAVFNTNATHMGRVRSIKIKGRRDFAKAGLDPAQLELPPHVPDLPEVRSDYAFHLEGVQDIDGWVGQVRADLEKRGLAEDTIIFFYSDHGGCLPRGKGFPFETGLRVPLVAYFPPKWQHLSPHEPGTATDRLVGFVDLAPTLLSLIGIKPPDHMQGRAFMGKYMTEPRELQFGFRTNQGLHYVPARTVTDGKYLYVRYYTPHKPYCVRNGYQWGMPANLAWDRCILEQACTSEAARQPYEPAPSEALFDVEHDRWNLHNLAADPAHAESLKRLRTALSQHIRETRDLGFFPVTLRNKPKPLYDWVRATNYPLDALYAAAELASNARPEDVSSLVALLKHDKPTFRFWGASGLATLASRHENVTCPPELLAALNDENPDVAAAAAEAAALLGEAEAAIPHLIKGAQQPELAGYAAGSALETLSWYEKPAIALLARADMLKAHRKILAFRSTLANLKLIPVIELYSAADLKKGQRTNKQRRTPGPLP